MAIRYTNCLSIGQQTHTSRELVSCVVAVHYVQHTHLGSPSQSSFYLFISYASSSSASAESTAATDKKQNRNKRRSKYARTQQKRQNFRLNRRVNVTELSYLSTYRKWYTKKKKKKKKSKKGKIYSKRRAYTSRSQIKICT